MTEDRRVLITGGASGLGRDIAMFDLPGSAAHLELIECLDPVGTARRPR